MYFSVFICFFFLGFPVKFILFICFLFAMLLFGLFLNCIGIFFNFNNKTVVNWCFVCSSNNNNINNNNKNKTIHNIKVICT